MIRTILPINNEMNPFKWKSKWTPPINREPGPRDLYKVSGKGDSTRFRWGPTHCSNDNIRSEERKALSSLWKRTDIVIKPVDKGSATVVMSKDDYLTRVMDHLNNTQFYEKLSDDATEWFSEEITSLLEEMREKRVLERETFCFLQPRNVRTSRFYILPKIHKPGIPGRPIVSSCRASTEKISYFVDHHLNPLVKKIPSYIKDTNDFLLKLQQLDDLSSESLLVTLDVISLYTNIPHQEGLDACRETLNQHESPGSSNWRYCPTNINYSQEK